MREIRSVRLSLSQQIRGDRIAKLRKRLYQLCTLELTLIADFGGEGHSLPVLNIKRKVEASKIGGFAACHSKIIEFCEVLRRYGSVSSAQIPIIDSILAFR